METQIGAQAPQLEFEYEEYSDDSDKASKPDDDGYCTSGEDTSCEGGCEEGQDCVDDSSDSETYEANACYVSFSKEDSYYASSKGISSVEGPQATLTTSSCYSLSVPEFLPHFGFIQKPLTSQGREYAQWLESQDEPSSRSDSPEIRSPIPRRLVHWREFPL